MKLLVFYPYLPYPLDRGTNHRTFHLLRALAAEFEVDLLALSEKGEGLEHQGVFKEFCHSVQVVPFQHPPWEKLFPHRFLNPLPPNIAHWTLPEVARVLETTLSRGNYQAAHICDIVLGQYFLKQHRSLPLVIDRSRVDLQYQLMEHQRMNFPFKTRLLRYEGYLKLWAYEKKIADRARLEVVCGPDDETFLRRYVRPKMPVAVVVNGADITYFHPESVAQPRETAPSIIFCGSMDYNPNIDALRWYFSEIHDPLKKRIPDLQVFVVGKSPVAEVKAYGLKKEVTVTGGVPDVRPYYRRAWLQIVPLRIGGGTRLKIVESLGVGTPVVSTSIGAQGLFLKDGEEILLADTAADFVQKTAQALESKPLREKLEKEGLKTARERFSWPKIGKQLCQIYRDRILSKHE